MTYFADFESVPWESPATGVRVKILKHSSKQVRLVEFSKEFVEPDWCRRGHAGYVISGECSVQFDGHTELLGPGRAFIVPAGESHKHMVQVSGDPVTLILVEDICE